MKKQFLSIFLACVLAFLWMPSITLAASTPMYDAGASNFYANGTPITITDDSGTTRITWADGYQLVPNNVTVYGGGTNGSSLDSASITMESGTVSTIIGGSVSTDSNSPASVGSVSIVINGGTVGGTVYGGGYLYSSVNSASVKVNGGEAGFVVGGGRAAGSYNGGFYNVGDESNPQASPCKVNSAAVDINDGKPGLVYGGGQGSSCTTNTVVNIKGGTVDYVTAGGSSGYTGSATVNVSGGSIDVVQGVNRGLVDQLAMSFTGGAVNNCYVGGESGMSDVTGVIGTDKPATFIAKAPANIKKLDPGTSGGKPYAVPGNEFIRKNDFCFMASCIGNLTDVSKYGTVINEYTITNKLPADDAAKNHGYLNIDVQKAIAGDPVTITIVPGEGWRYIAGSLAADTTGGIQVSLNNVETNVMYRFSMPEDGVTVTAAFEEIPVHQDYKMIQGVKLTFAQDARSATFASDAEFSKFVMLLVDGRKVAAENYTAKSGSTVITLNSKYISRLSVGNHTLEIVSSDGSAKTTFTVVKPLPRTGDSSAPVLWLGITILSLAGILLITRKKLPGNGRKS